MNANELRDGTQLARLRVEPLINGGVSFDGAGESEKCCHHESNLGEAVL